MAHVASIYGHRELLKWLCGEGGFPMDEQVMAWAITPCRAWNGNLELVQWLRAEGCPWDYRTCANAVGEGDVEVLRWARENGCPWLAWTRDRAEYLDYEDDFGNLVDEDGGFHNPHGWW